jgi:hypothetical protein
MKTSLTPHVTVTEELGTDFDIQQNMVPNEVSVSVSAPLFIETDFMDKLSSFHRYSHFRNIPRKDPIKSAFTQFPSARNTGGNTSPASPVVPAVSAGGCVSIHPPVETGTDVSTGREL